MNTLDRQVGGLHYTEKEVQPWQVIFAWNLDFHLATAIEYLARDKDREKRIEDLEKAIHNIERFIEIMDAKGKRLHRYGFGLYTWDCPLYQVVGAWELPLVLSWALEGIAVGSSPWGTSAEIALGQSIQYIKEHIDELNRRKAKSL